MSASLVKGLLAVVRISRHAPSSGRLSSKPYNVVVAHTAALTRHDQLKKTGGLQRGQTSQIEQ